MNAVAAGGTGTSPSGLTFDAEKHEYRLDGKVIPSVTQVLSPLYSWDHINPEVLRQKAELGTSVHYACELDNHGNLDESSVHEKVAGYLEGWRLFKREMKPEILLNEKRLYHPTRGYAGTLDLNLRMQGRLWLTDLKASVALYPQVGVQLAAYEDLLRVTYPELKREPILRAALQLKPNGTYKLGTFTNPGDLATFYGLLAVHHWRKNHG